MIVSNTNSLSNRQIADRIALLLSLLGILAGYLVQDRVFESMAHLEDEMAYVWQAQAIAGGHLTVPSPVEPKSFLIPFVIDYNGQRFGKYPLGWPAMLAIGEFFGLRHLVNPLLAGLCIWLTYRLARRLFGETVGLLSAGLMLTSPFFLMNAGSLLSHPFGLVLTLAFSLGWLDAFCSPAARGSDADDISARNPRIITLATLTAAGSLGLMALSRPFTAAAIALPFAIHGLYLLVRGPVPIRRRLLIFGLIAGGLSLLHFLWQYAVTGDPLLNPYTLWWAYDKIGFGPGIGHVQGGHTLDQAWINTRHSLLVGYFDLFGWPYYSWIFMIPGLWPLLRPLPSLLPIHRSSNNDIETTDIDNPRTFEGTSEILRASISQGILVICVLPCLVILYMAYWIGSSLFGPRYYFEGLHAAVMLSGLGIAWLAGWPTTPGQPFPNYRSWRKVRALAMAALLLALISINLLYYTPQRLGGMFGLYGVQRSYQQPFERPEVKALAPALIIVHPQKDWIEYGTLIDLENPFLDTPFIFTIYRSSVPDAVFAKAFPDRAIYHYYPRRDPFSFFPEPTP